MKNILNVLYLLFLGIALSGTAYSSSEKKQLGVPQPGAFATPSALDRGGGAPRVDAETRVFSRGDGVDLKLVLPPLKDRASEDSWAWSSTSLDSPPASGTGCRAVYDDGEFSLDDVSSVNLDSPPRTTPQASPDRSKIIAEQVSSRPKTAPGSGMTGADGRGLSGSASTGDLSREVLLGGPMARCPSATLRGSTPKGPMLSPRCVSPPPFVSSLRDGVLVTADGNVDRVYAVHPSLDSGASTVNFCDTDLVVTPVNGQGFTAQHGGLFCPSISYQTWRDFVTVSLDDHVARLQKYGGGACARFSPILNTLINVLVSCYDKDKFCWSRDRWKIEKEVLLKGIPALAKLDEVASKGLLFETDMVLKRFHAELMSLAAVPDDDIAAYQELWGVTVAVTYRMGVAYYVDPVLAQSLPVITYAIANLYEDCVGVPANAGDAENVWKAYVGFKTYSSKSGETVSLEPEEVSESDLRRQSHKSDEALEHSVKYRCDGIVALIGVDTEGASWPFRDESEADASFNFRNDVAESLMRRWCAYWWYYWMVCYQSGKKMEYDQCPVANGMIIAL